MKVKELIKELEKIKNQELEVLLEGYIGIDKDEVRIKNGSTQIVVIGEDKS